MNNGMMRRILRIIAGMVLLVLLAALALLVTGNGHVLYGLRKTYLIGTTKPDIDDMPYFDTRKIPADRPEPWAASARLNSKPLDAAVLRRMDSLETTAFLVIHRDSVLHESYFRGSSDTVHTNSFSMAKSFTGVLAAIAVEEGYIKSLDQPVGDFIPEFREGQNAGLTVRHLLEMSSGIPFGESYQNMFGYMARAYYGKDLLRETMAYRVERTPGSLWAYEGGNTVLLGMIVERATGRTCSRYFFEKVWSCIGAEHPAYWNLDKAGGMEKTYSGFYATARDFARVGKLFLHRGIWDQDTVLSPGMVAEILRPNGVPDDKGESCTWYGLHWWLGEHRGEPFFACRGLRGQYIIVMPEKDLVIVRIGHYQHEERLRHMPLCMYWYMDAALGLVLNEAKP
jgi:CubicO group peptidase (beta-lactamase class C family)